MHEFEIIQTYFAQQLNHRADVVLGIGDDAAIVKLPPDCELAITTDTLIEGVHFPQGSLAFDIGFKALAVNLSDLAAMGATPAWVTLALTLPKPKEQWLENFCAGFFTLANRHQVQLIGGDLTHGLLSITVQAMGFMPKGSSLQRSKAKPNDLIYITGTPGDAGLALQVLLKKIDLHDMPPLPIMERFNRPDPRIATGEQLRHLATAAIDISDGLAADLTHILTQSKVGAIIHVDQLPLSETLTHAVSHKEAIALALTGGDDYELCFTVPPEKRAELEHRLTTIPCRYTCIGQITEQLGLDLRYQNGNKYNGPAFGYQHF